MSRWRDVKTLAVVPVRYEASRFRGKALADLGGRPVVWWVVDAARRCSAFDEVIVATDDARIADVVRGFGGQVELTKAGHPSGTDRVAEVAERHEDADIVANIQGDQPFASPEMMSTLLQPYEVGERPAIATLACPLEYGDGPDPNVVKVVCDRQGYALYFSRSAVPYAPPGEQIERLHHLGLYAFTREALLQFTSFEPTPLERREQLEQLRALEHGVRIRVSVTDRSVLEVNTPADLERARAMLRDGLVSR
jgi:3-deoxy-manno-octulosonate cytidylyltransferase (CMP-KDO synthetase)